MADLLTARKSLIWQPQQPAFASKGGGLAVGLSEVIVPHARLSAVRRLPNVSRGTGIKLIQTPGGIAMGCTAFTNNGTVAALDWPHHGFRLTPPFTIGSVVYLNSSSTINFANMFTSNNSGWRLRASGGQFVADVTRAGATVTVTDATVQTVGTVHVLMFVVTASTIELYVDGVSVGSAAHSSYSAGGLATVAVSSLNTGGVQNAGGTLQLASWSRACTLADAVAYARNPWSVLEDDEESWFESAGGSTDYPVTRTESADASDTASLTIIYAATAAEIAEATSAHAAAMAAAVSIAETGEATSTQAAVLTAFVSINETGAATDSASSAGLYGVTVAEAADAADVESAIRALFVTASETGAATDTSSASLPGTYSVTVVEAANAEDAAAQAMSALVVIAEALAAADVANWVGAVIYTRAPRGGGYPATVQTTERYGTTNTKRPAMTNTRR